MVKINTRSSIASSEDSHTDYRYCEYPIGLAYPNRVRTATS